MQVQRNSSLIQIFTKSPELGKVKTRIADQVGECDALEIYRKMLQSVAIMAATFVNDKSSSDHRLLAELRVAGCLQNAALIELSRQLNCPIKPQNMTVDNLGQRMLLALQEGLCCNDQVLIIGGDAVAIDVKYLSMAVESLVAGSDLVIGPAEDGGYILIGLGKSATEKSIVNLFDGVSWGKETVLDETLSNAKKISLKTQLLDVRSDIDFLEDWLGYEEVCDRVINDFKSVGGLC